MNDVLMVNKRGIIGRDLAGLLTGLVLGMGFLLACLWHTWVRLDVALAESDVTASLIQRGEIGDVLPGQLLAFAAAAIIAHLALGLLAWGLARLSNAAFPGQWTRRRLGLITLWALVLAALVLMANGTWFPASGFASEESWLLAEWSGVRPVYLPLATVGMAVLAMGVRVLARRQPRRTWKLAIASGSIIGLFAAFALLPSITFSSSGAPAFEAPHVVILGIDSLRNDAAGSAGSQGTTPRLDEFLNGAHRFTDTVSPLARTYPAWTSILTGRDPVTTHARFNLMPRDLVHEGDTLGDALQAHGYRSVYATDEVRFANFDESYGFQQVITPPVGAIDFLLGKIGDLPLVNLVTQTRIGGWLFPSNRGNRAAYVTYRPGQFTERLRRELVVDRPGLYAIHLTLSHWPYSWAGMPIPSTPDEYRPAYRHAIVEADRQFAEVMQILDEKGVLANAIVVVLSDHGEALGWETDSMLRKVGSGDEIWNSLWGHGTSVMSPHQYNVLFAMRAYGRAHLPGVPSAYPWPVSLEDIRPTVQQLVTGMAPDAVDGLSLLPYLAGTADPAELQQRVRFTETGFNTSLMQAGQYNESGLVHEGAAYYELASGSGWVQLRRDRLPELLAQKQRAALTSNLLLAAIPDNEQRTVRYWLTDRDAPLPRRITARPDPASEPDAVRLWDALQARFRGELPELPDSSPM